MTVPSNTLYSNGVNVVTGDQLNTFVQTVTTTAVLRTFIGKSGVCVELQGITTAGDGGAGAFYWNPTSVAVDDNYNVIIPYGTASGAWNRLSVGSTTTALTVNGTPSIPYTAIGQPATAYATALIEGSTSRNTEREFFLSVNVQSTTGKGATSILSGDKVAGYFAVNASGNSGNVWGLNALVNVASGANANGGVNVAEYDLNNNSGSDFGNIAGTTGMAQPAAYGIQVSGLSANKSTAAIAVLGNLVDLVSPMWNRGIAFANNSVAQNVLADYTNCTTPIDLRGTHAGYGIDMNNGSFALGVFRIPAQATVVWRNAANAADLTMLSTNGSDQFLIGNASSTATVNQSPKMILNGISGPTWTTGAGAPSATEPRGSFYSRTGGGVGTTLYVTQGAGVWNAVAGV